MVAGALSDMTTREVAETIGQMIVRAGGSSEDSSGLPIYAGRYDLRVPISVFDPNLRREVHVMAKIRITVEREV